MDQGVQLPFSSVGIDDATFGMPTFKDGWKGLIITGSSQRALQSGAGGRLLLNVKCVMDPDNADVGKEHLIGLNLWHSDKDTADKADTGRDIHVSLHSTTKTTRGAGVDKQTLDRRC